MLGAWWPWTSSTLPSSSDVGEHVADVVGAAGVGRHRRGGARAQRPVGRVGARLDRQRAVPVVGQVGEQVGQGGDGVVLVVGDERRPGRWRGRGRPAPPSASGSRSQAGDRLDRGRAVDVGRGARGEHDVVGQAEEGGEATVAGPGHGEQQRHDARQRGRRGGRPGPTRPARRGRRGSTADRVDDAERRHADARRPRSSARSTTSASVASPSGSADDASQSTWNHATGRARRASTERRRRPRPGPVRAPSGVGRGGGRRDRGGQRLVESSLDGRDVGHGRRAVRRGRGPGWRCGRRTRTSSTARGRA